MSLTPDLVEWLLADKKVCQRWKSLARRLNLGSYIVSIERLCEEESGQLRLMLRLCQAVSPTSYTVRGIKSVLADEGLHHMWMWISLMTQDTPRHTTIQKAIHSATLPNRQLTSPSPQSGHLYNHPLLPSSKTYSYTSDYFSYPSTPDTSRPSSRLSDFNSHSNSRSSSQQRDYHSSTFHSLSHHTQSCPSTPLSTRRLLNSPTYSHTLPGRITPSPCHTTPPPKDHPTPGTRRVYDLLYRPDLIKLSSPRIVGKAALKTERSRQVLGENREYTQNSSAALKKHQSESLPNLKDDRYTSSLDIKFDNKKLKPAENEIHKSDHEKEILKLCDEIITEMNSTGCDTPLHSDVNRDDKCAKTKKLPSSGMTDQVAGAVGGKNQSENENNLPVNKMKIAKLSSKSQEKTDIQLGNYEKTTVCPDEYFDNLVKIIEKAVQDLSN